MDEPVIKKTFHCACDGDGCPENCKGKCTNRVTIEGAFCAACASVEDDYAL